MAVVGKWLGKEWQEAMLPDIKEFWRQRLAENESPIALTEDHIPSLERAIRAEGFDIKVDTETGEVKLYRRACVCDKGGLGDLCDGDCRLD